MHLTESELAALTHADGSARPEGVSTHVASCANCSARLEALRSADREVAHLLHDLDHPAPRVGGAAFGGDLRRRRSRIGAIAAGLALCAAGAAAALPNSPLHGLLIRALTRTGATRTPASMPESQSVVSAARAGVAFVPGSSLEVRFTKPNPGGRVRILLVDGARVSATADGEASFSVHQSHLEATDRGVAMTFTLEIPRSVSEVTVRAGNETIFEKRAGVVSGSHAMDSTRAYTFDFGSATAPKAPTSR